MRKFGEPKNGSETKNCLLGGVTSPYTAHNVKEFSFVLSLITVAGVAHADLRSEIMASRNKQEKAAIAKDIKGAEAALRESITSDFTFVQGGQTQDIPTFIKNYKDSIVMTEKVLSSSTRILSLKQNGNTGTAKTELKMTGTMKGADKKIHTMDWTGFFTEEFRKVGGKWKTSKMVAGTQKFLMDGKPAKF